MADDTNLADLVLPMGGALLCPQQDRQANEWMGWNWFLPENQKTNGVGETVLLRQLITDTLFQLKLSREASALVGISAGSAMATNLVFNSPQLFKCVVLIAGPAFACARSAEEGLQAMQSGPVQKIDLPNQQTLPPTLVIHGEKDSVVHASHLAELKSQWLQVWGKNGFDEKLTETDFSWCEQLIHQGQLFFTSHLVKDMGHAWPGGKPGCDFMSPPHSEGMQIIGDFLKSAWNREPV